jgi:RNA polymerase sigma factor (sigma-70 family)
MTDTQIVIGIMQNDERAWRFVCRNMKSGFSTIIRQAFIFGNFTDEDIEDLFQESCVVLMQKVKSGGVKFAREGAIFSYLVQIGKLTACNLVRKHRSLTSDEVVTISENLHKENEDYEISVDEKQKSQDEFLDRVFDSIPSDCKTLLKHFYWGRKSMDDIASILGMRNADSAKTKKTKCMNKFKDIAAKLIENDEFAEEAVRAAVERAALKELMNNELVYAEAGISMAALDEDEDTED